MLGLACLGCTQPQCLCGRVPTCAPGLQEYGILLGRHLHRVACSAGMPHEAVTRHLQAAAASGVLLCLLNLERLEPAQSSTLSARIKQVIKVSSLTELGAQTAMLSCPAECATSTGCPTVWVKSFSELVLQAPVGQQEASLISPDGSFTAAAGFMLSCTLGASSSQAGAAQLPGSLQSVLRPVKFLPSPLGMVAEALLTAQGFTGAMVRPFGAIARCQGLCAQFLFWKGGSDTAPAVAADHAWVTARLRAGPGQEGGSAAAAADLGGRQRLATLHALVWHYLQGCRCALACKAASSAPLPHAPGRMRPRPDRACAPPGLPTWLRLHAVFMSPCGAGGTRRGNLQSAEDACLRVATLAALEPALGNVLGPVLRSSIADILVAAPPAAKAGATKQADVAACPAPVQAPSEGATALRQGLAAQLALRSMQVRPSCAWLLPCPAAARLQAAHLPLPAAGLHAEAGGQALDGAGATSTQHARVSAEEPAGLAQAVPEQIKCMVALAASLAAGHVGLLCGATGSGKTAVWRTLLGCLQGQGQQACLF